MKIEFIRFENLSKDKFAYVAIFGNDSLVFNDMQAMTIDIHLKENPNLTENEIWKFMTELTKEPV